MTRTFDPFRVLSDEEREAQLRDLERFFEQRDGEVDLPNLRLSKREEYMRPREALAPRWPLSFDREAFHQAFYRRDRSRLDPREAWLVSLARCNESESYGVGEDYKRFMRGECRTAKPPEITILVEERYHIRMLLDACRVFGLDVELQRPRWLMRMMIRSMHYLPDSIRYIPIVCGEVLGTIVFGRLRDATDLFADDPEVEERLHAYLSEITLDEIAHVLFCRARMGPVSLRVARLMGPLVALALVKDVPQLRDIGLDRREIVRRMRLGVEVPTPLEWAVEEPDAAGGEAVAPV